jgi:hypothetical protein
MLDNEIAILLEDAIVKDGKFIADVYKLRKANKTVREISESLGHKNSLTVTSFDYALEALFSRVPVGQLKHNSRQQFVMTAKRLLASSNSSRLNAYLEGLLKDENANTSDTAIDVEEVLEFSTVKSGVYVYSYPQYLSMEAISPDGKALYKIGASTDTDKRVKRQRRQTEVPEDLVLVRVFHCENAFETEKKFHNILSSANFHHKSTLGGTEWFNCNLATIDAIAAALNLHDESETI